ncbi:MAG TPA: diguanylate cyclase [Roseiflexaceae bacterium]|nr:diguanylate cyclase [Roseiflexaceae bacterium]
MHAAPLPDDEVARLATLLCLRILDTPPEERFDRITRLVAAHFDVPVAAINLVDAERQWTKAGVGMPKREMPRAISFCAHALLEQEALVVADASQDKRFHDNPQVTSPDGIRFYVGVPLRSEDGYAIGSLCLADTRPRRFSSAEIAHLRDFAGLAERELSATQISDVLLRKQQSEARFRAAAEGNFDAFFLLESVRDAEGRICDFRFVYANKGAERIINLPREQLVGRLLCELIPINRSGGFFDRYVRVVETGAPLEEEFPISAPEICAEWLHHQVVPVDDGIAITSRDVSERRRSQAALQEAVRGLEERAHTIALLHELSDLLHASETLDEAATVVSTIAQALFAQTAGTLYYRSDLDRPDLAAVAHWGIEPDEAALPPQLCHAAQQRHVHYVPAGGQGAPCPHQRAPRADTLCVPLMHRDAVVGLLYLVDRGGARLDTTARQQLAMTVADQAALALGNIQLRDELRRQALHDPLTGLYNRRYLDVIFPRELERVAGAGLPLSVVMADIDHFKQINDSLGHAAGDRVLKAVGAVLRAQVRGGDVVCRTGGEEFVLLLPGADQEAAAARAEQLRAAIAALTITDPPLPQVTISLGVASFPRHGKTPADLLAVADAALYRAKAAGRDRVVMGEGVPD